VPYNHGEETRRLHGERIAEDIAHRLEFPTDTLAYVHQTAAAASHSTVSRLRRITAPTLVVHGENDAVVPPKNADVLAGAIPDAELKLWPGAGHVYTTDEPRADHHIARFLLRHSGAQAGRDGAELDALQARRSRRRSTPQSDAA
jgi:pimeloyl-ACP methyl ester carboxylesterase